jgi:UPF0271 protein
MSLRVDLNADLGEGAGADAELLPLVSSASIACGGHAGDETTIRECLAAARVHGVAVGAHPSFVDREHFGRREMDWTPDALRAQLIEQIQLVARLARETGLVPRHVKPHGALYNMAARDAALAEVIASAVAAVNPELRVFAPPASALAAAAERCGLRPVREFFADRNYLANRGLVPRSHPEALLHDPAAAAARVLRVLQEGCVRAIGSIDVPMEVETICIHGDSPGAVEFARELRRRLEAVGVQIAAAV